MTEDLLRLLAQAHPERSQGDLLAMLDEIPDKAPRKPAHARCGSRPRTPASLERRRSWAASGLVPARLAANFTPGEIAVLSLIAAEVKKRSLCDLPLDQIAAQAGVGRTTVKRALRQAHALKLIRIEERRLSRWRNDTNVVTIIDPAWSSWLRLGRGGGVQFVSSPPDRSRTDTARAWNRGQNLPEGRVRERAAPG
jgi:hypothetical protein